MMTNVEKTAKSYAARRSLHIGKNNPRFKIKGKDLKEELTTAVVYGELSALERFLEVVKNDKELTREEIEAELHLAIVDYNKIITQRIGFGKLVTLDQYLGMQGYH